MKTTALFVAVGALLLLQGCGSANARGGDAVAVGDRARARGGDATANGGDPAAGVAAGAAAGVALPGGSAEARGNAPQPSDPSGKPR